MNHYAELTNSEIQTAKVSDGGLTDVTAQVTDLINSIGLFIENGIAKFNDFIAEKAIIKDAEIKNLAILGKMRVRDQATDEIYCTWIENGEWKKVSGNCENIPSGIKVFPKKNLLLKNATMTVNPVTNRNNSTTTDFGLNQNNATTTKNIN